MINVNLEEQTYLYCGKAQAKNRNSNPIDPVKASATKAERKILYRFNLWRKIRHTFDPSHNNAFLCYFSVPN